MAPHVLVIDNYDSFTYNLVQALGKLGASIIVRRNDKVSMADIEKMAPRKILISPGPCGPVDAGISMEAIKGFAGKKPILGVCLGHQCIGAAFGGDVVRAEKVMHGKTSMIEHDGKGVFEGIASPLEGMRYHSLVVAPATLPDMLEVTARTQDGVIMGVRCKSSEKPIEGVQFHPESFLTATGEKLLENFLKQ